MASTTTPLVALAALIRDGENVISPYVRDPDEAPTFGALAAAGPRAAEAPEEYTLLVEAIREGYLLHYEEPRLIDGADPDLRLLAGDYLYALGLERLAARGDLEAVRELADLISLSAQIHVEDGAGAGTERVARRSPPSTLASAAALWLAATVAVAAGSTPEHEQAKDSLRAGDPEAGRKLLESAARTAHRAGIGDALARAAESVGFAAEDVAQHG
jgi:hypothetical protein